MSTDRELLELAAKAAGVDLAGGVDEHGAYEENWNPLTNDGDALRLAVKLHLFDSGAFWGFRLIETRKNPKNDDCTIARRAITRAAAEIGKAKEDK